MTEEEKEEEKDKLRIKFSMATSYIKHLKKIGASKEEIHKAEGEAVTDLFNYKSFLAKNFPEEATKDTEQAYKNNPEGLKKFLEFADEFAERRRKEKC